MKFIVLIALTLLIAGQVKADLPVHCLKKQIVGKWTMELSSPISSDQNQMVNCGHASPDNEKSSLNALANDFTKDSDLSFSLQDNNVVKGKENDGSWTMIYDEGFEISYSNYKFFTFSKYVSTGFEYESECDQTIVGWYNNQVTGEKGCARGYQPNSAAGTTKNIQQDKVVQPKSEDKQKEEKKSDDNKNSEIKTIEQPNEGENLLAQKVSYAPEPDLALQENKYEFQDGFIYAQTQQNEHSKSNKKSNHLRKNNKQQQQKDSEPALDLHKGFNDHQAVVDRLNKVQKSWTAKVPEEFQEFNMEEMNRRAGTIRKHGKSSPFTLSFAQTSKSDQYANYSREDVSDLPKELSFLEYLHDPVQQKDCGSCYAIATSEMISSRLNFKFGEDVKISAQHSLDCNFYNQGCDGGYGYLVSKFGSEYEMVSEECHPYKAVNGSCKNSCDVSKLNRTYKVQEYNYIGGAYGKSSERLMMQEMMQNGPIVVSFEPAYDFMYYSEGIYHSVDAEDWLKEHEQQPAWEKVDHSVLAYGWGEENGEKYWNVLNSWGQNWGEEGHFRIRRGTDESHVESMGEYAIPYIINK